MNAVPANQTVSFTTYWMAIQNAVPGSYDALKPYLPRIERAFDMGEPLWAIVDELKLRLEMTSIRRTKTPREMAVRVVQVAQTAVTVASERG